MDSLLIVRNIVALYAPLEGLISAFCYAAGSVFIVVALFHFYQPHGRNQRSTVSSSAGYWGLGIALILFALPEFFATGGMTLFGDSNTPSPLAYADIQPGGPVLAPIAGAIKLFGAIFSISGLFVMRAWGVHGPANGNTPGKGMVKIIAGLFLFYLEQTLKILSSLTGLNLGANLFY